MQVEVPLRLHINQGTRSCQQSLDALRRRGFRLGNASEVGEYANLKGSYGTPLIFAGGPIQCDHQGQFSEADIFLVRDTSSSCRGDDGECGAVPSVVPA